MKLNTLPISLLVVLGAALLGSRVPAADPVRPAAGTLVVIDSAGKEQKLTAWHFTTGTRHLSWLVPPAQGKEATGDPKEPRQPHGPAHRPTAGPEALEFRDEHSTNFVDGILTLIPLERLRALEYDADKDTVRARVALGTEGAEEEVLTGSTKFRGINKIVLAAEVDKGDLGVAEVKYQGGVPRGLRGIRFPEMKVAAPDAGGRRATITIADKEKKVQQVADLLPLYRLADGSERALPTLFFRKTLKLDVAKVRKLKAIESKEADGSEWEVTLNDGSEETWTLLAKPTVDGKPATLEGLVGRVPVGFKLFPIHTVAEIEFAAP
jgi:hypothetical protein